MGLRLPVCGLVLFALMGCQSVPKSSDGDIAEASSSAQPSTLNTPSNNKTCKPSFKQIYQPPLKLGGTGRVILVPSGERCRGSIAKKLIQKNEVPVTAASYQDYSDENFDFHDTIEDFQSILEDEPFLDIVDFYVKVNTDYNLLLKGIDGRLEVLLHEGEAVNWCEEENFFAKYDFNCSNSLGDMSAAFFKYFSLAENYMFHAPCNKVGRCLGDKHYKKSLEVLKSIAGYSTAEWINPDILEDPHRPNMSDSTEIINSKSCKTALYSNLIYQRLYRYAKTSVNKKEKTKALNKVTANFKYFSNGVLSEDSDFQEQYKKCAEWERAPYTGFSILEISNIYNSLLSKAITADVALDQLKEFEVKLLKKRRTELSIPSGRERLLLDDGFTKQATIVLYLSTYVFIYENYNESWSRWHKDERSPFWYTGINDFIDKLEMHILTFSPKMNRTVWRQSARTLVVFYDNAAEKLMSDGDVFESLIMKKQSVCTLAAIHKIGGVCE